MPYISKEQRESMSPFGPDLKFQAVIDTAISHIKGYPMDDREGMANYAISRIVAGSLKPDDGWHYFSLNHAHGTFFSAAAEFYRRLLAPREDSAIEKNGDIPEYE